MLRAAVGRQGRLDVVPGIFFSAIIWKLRQQSHQVVGPMQRLCGCAGCSPCHCPFATRHPHPKTFWAVEHIGHSTFLPLLPCFCFKYAKVSQNTVTCHWCSARWERNLGPNARGPKTEPRVWHRKSVPPLLPASVSDPPKGPKNGAAKPPTCPALVRKVSRANRSASCSITPAQPPSPPPPPGNPFVGGPSNPYSQRHCRVQIGGSRQLRLFSASAPFSCCSSMRARKARERKETKQPGMHICVISS